MIDKTFPLVDIHRHLDGNVRLGTIVELARRFNVPLPAQDEAGMKPYVHVIENEPSLVAFLAKLDWMVKVLGDVDACYRVAYENVEDAAKVGIDYTELRFSPWYMAMSHNLDPNAVVEAVAAGVAAGSRDFGVKTNLIGIMSRTFGTAQCQRELDAILAHRDQLVAVDLAGDELGFPGPLYEPHFRQVQDAGLKVTVHAGEAAGPESVWHAIRELGAVRIGHGVKAVEDPKLLAYLAEHHIGIESCLTSNIHTSTVASYAVHPITTFLASGIKVSLNTDDPGVSAVELDHEYEVAAPKAGLSLEQIQACQRHGLAMSFLSEAEKKALIAAK
ncbi:adenosine deaminase [Gallaecimonas pentaromativorans]|uniref:Adenosine deaminase n=1 Tax=Gallaecimonas pentaromativorans TaxID=584787 RepID=A0A3N1NZ69_9GAMM|nr:adenosine deaminase [Gallaecimonas pentaromativorans]ROQ24272.1 adenosine deaminase [Gallaecimonas pentaromativorans]